MEGKDLDTTLCKVEIASLVPQPALIPNWASVNISLLLAQDNNLLLKTEVYNLARLLIRIIPR